MNFKVLLKYHKDHHTLKLLTMLKVLQVKTTASIVHNSHHKQNLNTYATTTITLVKYFTAKGDIFFTLHTTLIH